MFDFPSNPTNGQIITTPSGASYLWDSVKWGPTGTLNNDVVNSASVGNTGRNLLHNGRFDIAQRGTGGFAAPGPTAVYSADRWVVQAGASGDNISLTPTASSDTDRAAIGDESATNYAALATTGGSGASNFCRLLQKLEGIRRVSGKTVTVSFWAVGSVANKLGVSIDQYFGTGGSPSASVLGNGQSVTITTGWARYSFTFSVPSASSKTLGSNGDAATILNIWTSAGANNSTSSGGVPVQGAPWYCNIWGVQLEVGSVATPLAKRDIADELSLCQRFYQIGNFQLGGYANAGIGYYYWLSFPAAFRATPNVAPTFTQQVNCGSSALQNTTGNGTQVYTIGTAAGGYALGGNYTASADL